MVIGPRLKTEASYKIMFVRSSRIRAETAPTIFLIFFM